MISLYQVIVGRVPVTITELEELSNGGSLGRNYLTTHPACSLELKTAVKSLNFILSLPDYFNF
jgi:hypothetical protein